MEQEKLLLNGGVRVVLDEPQDYTAELYEVVQKWRRQIWLKPDHQRDFVWDDAKVQAWIDRLATATHNRSQKPVGVIVTYQIDDGTPSAVYVNDGSQRIRATIKALDDPKKFGYTAETVQQIVEAIRIPIQHRYYKSQDDALTDFQLLNMGTSLTPREMCKGILVNHPLYRQTWEPLFQTFHHLMASIGGGLVLMPKKAERRQSHKFERHDFSMLVRWLKHDGLTDHRNVATSELRKDQIDKGQVIETDLRAICSTLNPDLLRQEMTLLMGHVQRQVAIYREVWDRVRPAPGKGISPTLFRWLIDISIWAKQSDIPLTDWEMFVEQLMIHTQGTSIVQDPNEMRNRVTLGLGNVGHLKAVCAILGSSLYVGKQPRRRGGKLLPGYDNSHIDPFATNGNGPTVPEPASRNRARGAKPIEANANA